MALPDIQTTVHNPTPNWFTFYRVIDGRYIKCDIFRYKKHGAWFGSVFMEYPPGEEEESLEFLRRQGDLATVLHGCLVYMATLNANTLQDAINDLCSSTRRESEAA